jgi:nicotinamidase-related amidase
MRGKNPDLHGYAPDSAPLALLIVDMLSDFEFEGSEQVFASALTVARNIARLKARARAAGVPCIYVNDNVGKWQSAVQRVVDQATHPEHRGHPIGALLQPSNDDYVVLKPKHSAFFATPLELLLSYIGASALILTGMTRTQCILFTAVDAYVRDFSLYIPEDCTAAQSDRDRRVTRHLFQSTLKADTRAAAQLRMPALLKRHAGARGR